MILTFTLLIIASILYTFGGIAMKLSQGFQSLIPSAFVFIFFCIAAGLQTWAMKKAELGKSYLFVIGLEGIFAVIAGILLFDESVSLNKAGGILLILSGMILLKL